jgi:chorismate mutase
MKIASLFASLSVAAIAMGSTISLAQDAAKVNYDEHIRPILREHCFTCHHQGEKKGGLALDSYASAMTGGSSGDVVGAGDIEISRLYALVTHADQPFMPPNQDKIPEPKISLLKQWIEQGALENAGSKATVKKKKSAAMSASPTTGRPEGPPPMPENVMRQPLYTAARTGSATALAASPWAPLAAVGAPKQIVLYDTDTADCVGVLPFPEGTPYVLKFSRNGSVLMAGGGRGGQSGYVVLFDVKTGKRLAKIGDELDTVLAADINDTQTMVALGGPQKVIRVYAIDTGEKLFEIKKHTDWIYALAFSPDGVLLASTDRSGGVFVWESATAREYLSLRGHNGAVCDVAWRPDSNVLATTGEDTTVRLWEMNDGNQIKNWGAHGGGGFSVNYAHDGRLVSSGRDKAVRTWNGDGAALKGFGMPEDALKCAITHDGKRVIGGDWAGNIKMWDHEQGTEIASLTPNPPMLAARLEAAKAQLATANAAKQATAAELAAAEKNVAEVAAALKAATDAAAAKDAAAKDTEQKRVAAAEALTKSQADLVALSKKLEEAQAAAKAATEAKEAAAKVATDKETAVKATTDQLEAAKAAAKKAIDEASADAQALAKVVMDAAAAAKAAADEQAAAVVALKQKTDELAAVAKTVADTEALVVAAKTKVAADEKLAADATAVATNEANAYKAAVAEVERVAKVKADTDAAAATKKAPADQAAQVAAGVEAQVNKIAGEIVGLVERRAMLNADIAVTKAKLAAMEVVLAAAQQTQNATVIAKAQSDRDTAADDAATAEASLKEFVEAYGPGA